MQKQRYHTCQGNKGARHRSKNLIRVRVRVRVRVRCIVDSPSQKVEPPSHVVESLSLVVELLSSDVEFPSYMVEYLSLWSNRSLDETPSPCFYAGLALDPTDVGGIT